MYVIFRQDSAREKFNLEKGLAFDDWKELLKFSKIMLFKNCLLIGDIVILPISYLIIFRLKFYILFRSEKWQIIRLCDNHNSRQNA